MLQLRDDRERDRFGPFAAEAQARPAHKARLELRRGDVADFGQQRVAPRRRTEQADVTRAALGQVMQAARIEIVVVVHHEHRIEMARADELDRSRRRPAA